MAKPQMKMLMPHELLNKVAVVVGTRPGIIKMSPLIRELKRRGIEHLVIHTGQHYSYEMDKILFENLELPDADYHLDQVSKCYFHGEQTAEMIKGVEQALLDARPKVVLVCGDANTNLSAGLAARKLRMIVGHVESGLRSHDWSMPEEHNRVILDHICELLFAPTESTRENLLKDNVKGEIYVTGNTIVDAALENLNIAKRKSSILDQLSLQPEGYFICTAHREENVDVKERFEQLLDGLYGITQEYKRPVVFPIHPRTRRRLSELGLSNKLQLLAGCVKVIEPLGYLDFLLLLSKARLVLTDSGGIQEESCILQVPCVTLRDNTERPETLAVGSNKLAGINPDRISEAVAQMINVARTWSNPYGDGTSSKQIIDAVQNAITKGVSLDENIGV